MGSMPDVRENLNEQQSAPLMDEAEQESTYTPNDYIIPDGGWGWMVTFSVFFIYVILDGSVFSFGIIYVELLEYFNESGGKTALIAASLYGLPLILAPFICALVIHVGFRLVGILGGLMVVSAFLLCVLANSIDFIAFALGLFGAAGMEMGYVSAILCISYYFDKYRGLATGLAMSGSGVGTFFFPPILELCLQKYSWRGTCLLLAGISLNLIPLSLVFRPLKKKKKPERVTFTDNDLTESPLKYCSKRRMSKSTTDLPAANKLLQLPHKSSLPNLSARCKTPHQVQKLGLSISNSYHHGGYALAFSVSNLQVDQQPTPTDDGPTDTRNLTQKIRKSLLSFYKNVLKILHSSVDWKLLKEPGFMLFSFSNILLCIYFALPYIYIPHLAQLSGINEQYSSFLVSIIGITTTVFQIIIGYVSDTLKAPICLYLISMIICGSSLTVMPLFADTYWILCLLCVLFGIGISANYALTTVILIDLLGIEKLTVSFGMFQLQQGVASLFGTPIGGWIYDATGSYYWAFISGGVCIILSGLVLIPVPIFMKHRRVNLCSRDDNDTELQVRNQREIGAD